jgi:hypothetical protein
VSCRVGAASRAAHTSRTNVGRWPVAEEYREHIPARESPCFCAEKSPRIFSRNWPPTVLQRSHRPSTSDQSANSLRSHITRPTFELELKRPKTITPAAVQSTRFNFCPTTNMYVLAKTHSPYIRSSWHKRFRATRLRSGSRGKRLSFVREMPCFLAGRQWDKIPNLCRGSTCEQGLPSIPVTKPDPGSNSNEAAH